jgi:hypothetical protein
MATAKINPSSDELIQDLQRLYQKHGKVSRDAYEKQGKFTRVQFEKHWKSFGEFVAAAGLDQSLHGSTTHAETSEISGDKWSVSVPKTRIHTLEQLIEYFEVDLSIWEVERFRANKWEMPYTTGAGNERKAAVEPVYQVRADFKKKKDVLAVKKEISELLAEAKKFSPMPIKIARGKARRRMLEVNIPDIHFGKLAWGRETGEKVVFVVGNDLLQADDNESQTTSGTIVTTDARYKKTFKVARRSVIRAIEKLRVLGPVDVIIVPGNHDELSVWHLGESLEIYFHKYDDVTVNNEPASRKIVEFGNVMLMLCHGHRGKRNDYPLQMATEFPQVFGRTKWRETHCGHNHQTKLDEQHGVRVRVLPALCPPDDWHSENGFTGNLRVAEAFVWDAVEGLLNILYYNDEAQPDVNTKHTAVIG